jgi:CRP-like cAMP-binding protein
MSLYEFPVFKGLSHTDIDNIMNAATRVQADKGTVLMREGETHGDLFFLLRGKVRVTVMSGDKPQELAVIEAPAVLGEMEYLTRAGRAASVSAVEAVECLKLAAEEIDRRIKDGDAGTLKVFFNISRVLASRLSAMNRRIAEIAAGAPAKGDELKAFQQMLLSDWSF